jgi:hypothetical protein
VSIATQAIQALLDSNAAWQDTGSEDDYEYCQGRQAGLFMALDASQAAEAADLDERAKRFTDHLKSVNVRIDYNDI